MIELLPNISVGVGLLAVFPAVQLFVAVLVVRDVERGAGLSEHVTARNGKELHCAWCQPAAKKKVSFAAPGPARVDRVGLVGLQKRGSAIPLVSPMHCRHSLSRCTQQTSGLVRSVVLSTSSGVDRSGSSRRSNSGERLLCRPPSPLGADGQLPTMYDFASAEKGLYQWWEAAGLFKPRPPSAPGKKAYTIPMPPPNVTGRLHMGHALFVALQDILARFHRMRGRPTLWLPGTDHAGIATQMLVERELAIEGLTREGMGREAFLERAWKYKAENAGAIVQQV